MFLTRTTEQYTNNCLDNVSALRQAIEEADTIIIGAGAGLSTSAGLEYTGARLHKYFQDFVDKYGFKDMYSAGFYPYETMEENWAFWSRYIYINRYMKAPKPVYERLLELACDKDYFVLTTNVDHQFQKAGFDKNRLFYTQGDYGLWQCSKPCTQVTYDNEETVMKMVQLQENMKIPNELVPHCPNCGAPMTMNLRADSTFVEDAGWHKAAGRYKEFLDAHEKSKTLFLELGTGYNTPVIIKYPFWQMTKAWSDATFACINMGEAVVPDEIKNKSICIDGDIGETLEKL